MGAATIAGARMRAASAARASSTRGELEGAAPLSIPTGTTCGSTRDPSGPTSKRPRGKLRARRPCSGSGRPPLELIDLSVKSVHAVDKRTQSSDADTTSSCAIWRPLALRHIRRGVST